MESDERARRRLFCTADRVALPQRGEYGPLVCSYLAGFESTRSNSTRPPRVICFFIRNERCRVRPATRTSWSLPRLAALPSIATPTLSMFSGCTRRNGSYAIWTSAGANALALWLRGVDTNLGFIQSHMVAHSSGRDTDSSGAYSFSCFPFSPRAPRSPSPLSSPPSSSRPSASLLPRFRVPSPSAFPLRARRLTTAAGTVGHHSRCRPLAPRRLDRPRGANPEGPLHGSATATDPHLVRGEDERADAALSISGDTALHRRGARAGVYERVWGARERCSRLFALHSHPRTSHLFPGLAFDCARWVLAAMLPFMGVVLVVWCAEECGVRGHGARVFASAYPHSRSSVGLCIHLCAEGLARALPVSFRPAPSFLPLLMGFHADGRPEDMRLSRSARSSSARVGILLRTGQRLWAKCCRGGTMWKAGAWGVLSGLRFAVNALVSLYVHGDINPMWRTRGLVGW
ncbi:hypothetical protein C8R44DRAFT_885050 [Mycena epipterygia]|nr:hypothetical protein C8R44DRAFT_885050 [Mycena epipterygia]